ASRHRRSGRRRVRQIDGAQGELPSVVELFVPASGRARARHRGALRHAGAAVATGRGRAHELCRPPRSSEIRAAYADPDSGITTGPRAALWPVCVSKLTYVGHAAIQSDIANFKTALQAAGVEEGFMTSIAPGSASRIANRYYKTDEEFLYACADAMHEE